MDERPQKHCCEEMGRQAEWKCEQHSDRFECPDCVIHPLASGGYGLIIHDGGSSFYRINFCPWCGTNIAEA